MASSWGDERISHRFRSNEIWLDMNDFESLAEETQNLVEKLERVNAALSVPDVGPAPRVVAATA